MPNAANFVRDKNNREHHGLSAQPYKRKNPKTGKMVLRGYRFYFTFSKPRQWIGIYPTRDDPDAIKQFYRMRDEAKRVTIIEPEKFPCGYEGQIPHDLPEEVLWAWTVEQFNKDKKNFADRLGEPRIAWLDDLKPPPDPIILKDAGDSYFNDKQGEIDRKEWDNAKVFWKEFCDITDAETVNELTYDHFRAFSQEIKRRRRQNSPKTGKARGNSWVRSRFEIVTRIINYTARTRKISAAKHLELKHEWAEPLRKPKQPKGKKNIITPEEFKAMYDAADDFMKGVVLVGVNCAFPPGDFDLTWDDVDLKKGIIDYRRTKRDTGDVEGVLRTAVLFKETVKALKTLKKQSKGAYVFAVKSGKPADQKLVWAKFKALKKLAKIKRNIRPEDMRNTAATIAAQNTPVMQYNVLMGHTVGSENEGYIERNPRFTQDAVYAIGDYLEIE